MLKALGTLRLVRPLVNGGNLAAAAVTNNAQFHTSVKRLGGGDHEFLVNKKNRE